MFLEVNPCFQRAHVFSMDLQLQPAANPYNVVCKLICNIQTKILMLLFKLNSHIKKYFDDFLNGYSLAMTFAN